MSKSNGGAAFPSNDHFDSGNNYQCAETGMNLRDYFAAKAMQAIIMNPETQRELADTGRDEGMIVIATVAYMQADAMILERAK